MPDRPIRSAAPFRDPLLFGLVAVLALGLVGLGGCRYPSPSTPLDQAAVEGDGTTVRALLHRGDDPNAYDADGWTALHWAARAGKLETTRLLLEGGAQPDVRDRYVNGWTPLMHAAHKHQAATVQALLQAGADPNARNPIGITALMLACSEDDEDVVRVLLNAGADPRLARQDGGTALFDAVSAGEPENARLLLARDPGLRLPPGMMSQGALLLTRLRGESELARRVAPGK